MGCNERCIDLGKPVGESTIVQNRKAQSVTNEFEGGWTIVAARVGKKSKHKFRAVIYRCRIEHNHSCCLGTSSGVTRLTAKIRSTYT